ncbi:hypothetical protein PHLCEN_2v4420 [Hermanssonia centrifuga]|uniref:Uncharacterized protein n=1 Tax=Hermanssonia centrifuga TaxID=98765 RepID=A0A2R6PNJ9_9APHY|nr:hypothetical protein PHLCEN_2v4420 [Hermanssonia centrifuga]
MITDVHDLKNGDQQWKSAVGDVEQALILYRKAKADGDTDVKTKLEQEIPHRLRAAGDCAPDPETRAKLCSGADAFEKGDEKSRWEMIHPLLQGLAILLATPFAVAGVAIVASGTILYGSGKVLLGFGDLLTAGPVMRWKRRKAEAKATKKEKLD